MILIAIHLFSRCKLLTNQKNLWLTLSQCQGCTVWSFCMYSESKIIVLKRVINRTTHNIHVTRLHTLTHSVDPSCCIAACLSQALCLTRHTTLSWIQLISSSLLTRIKGYNISLMRSVQGLVYLKNGTRPCVLVKFCTKKREQGYSLVYLKSISQFCPKKKGTRLPEKFKPCVLVKFSLKKCTKASLVYQKKFWYMCMLTCCW